MSMNYTVGMTHDGKAEHVTIEAEDALIAALRVKAQNPEAMITYTRKTNTRGDQRNPTEEIGK